MGMEVVTWYLCLLLEMAHKVKKTLTRAEQAKLKRENAKRAKIMAGQRRNKMRREKGEMKGEEKQKKGRSENKVWHEGFEGD